MAQKGVLMLPSIRNNHGLSVTGRWQVGAAAWLVPHEMQEWMAGPTLASGLHMKGSQTPGP